MTYVLMTIGVLCFLGGLLTLFSNVAAGAVGGLFLIGGLMLVGIGAVVDELSAIRKILKDRKV